MALLALFLAGMGVGGLAVFLYHDYKYFVIERSKVPSAAVKWREQGLGELLVVFEFYPPKPKEKPLKTLSIIKGERNE
jgi:hypothetical protein